jgi:hypothetical protein
MGKNYLIIAKPAPTSSVGTMLERHVTAEWYGPYSKYTDVTAEAIKLRNASLYEWIIVVSTEGYIQAPVATAGIGFPLPIPYTGG